MKNQDSSLERRKKEILKKIAENKKGSLVNEKICLFTQKAPEDTVRFPGCGDEFAFYPILCGKLDELGCKPSISPKKFLTKAFGTCSSFDVIPQGEKDVLSSVRERVVKNWNDLSKKEFKIKK